MYDTMLFEKYTRSRYNNYTAYLGPAASSELRIIEYT